MTLFQLLMLGASAFFAFKIYEHIQTLKDKDIKTNDNVKDDDVSLVDISSLIDEADSKMESGDFQKALAIYSEAKYQEPNNAETLFKMGYALMKQDRLDEALEYYMDALKIDGENPSLYQAVASLYRQMGDFHKAKQYLDSALKLDSSNPITYYNYGNLLVDMDEKEEAKEMYKKALELDEDFKEAQAELDKL